MLQYSTNIKSSRAIPNAVPQEAWQHGKRMVSRLTAEGDKNQVLVTQQRLLPGTTGVPLKIRWSVFLLCLLL